MALEAYEAARIRNVALIGHGGAGKTSVAEGALFAAGAIPRLGSVVAGTTASDYDPEEVRRGLSLRAALLPIEWEGHKINLIDTPGYFDFAGEVRSALRVVEGAVMVVCAAAGVEVGTELAWEMADDQNLPRLVFINKMDRENASFERTFGALRERFGPEIVPVQMPIGAAAQFRGLIDLIRMEVVWAAGGPTPGPVPAELAETAEALRAVLVEAVAATDDELTMKFLADEPLSAGEIERALASGAACGSLIPVLCGSASSIAGMRSLLEACRLYLPAAAATAAVSGEDPRTGEPLELPIGPSAPLAALVFKTLADPYVGKISLLRVYAGALRSESAVHNPARGSDERIGQLFGLRGKEQIPIAQAGAGDLVAVAKLQETATGDTLADRDRPVRLGFIGFPKPAIAMAVKPRSKGDEEKVGIGLGRLLEEDPALAVEKNSETGQLLLSGVGEMHLEVVVSTLQRKFGITVDLETPRVPYREALRRTVQAEYRHKKQSGGRGQYGHVVLSLEPLPPGGGFEFVDKIFGGAVPKQYIPAVEKGLREAMSDGVVAGFPVVDVRVALLDGSYHSVDSSEMAFKIAASMAFKKGFLDASPILLEPVVKATVFVPETAMGDVIGDLNKKRGRILGLEPHGKDQRVQALVPLAEMFRYAIDLRSLTQGRGRFETEFSRYEEVPAQIAQQVIAAAREKAS